VRFSRDAGSAYEERLTLWRAADFAHAVALAEADVEEYAAAVGGSYLGLAQAYALSDEPGQGAEVFSLMRSSSLDPDAYLDAFFDTGDERQGVTADEG
jgi:hypothetical protein